MVYACTHTYIHIYSYTPIYVYEQVHIPTSAESNKNVALWRYQLPFLEKKRDHSEKLWKNTKRKKKQENNYNNKISKLVHVSTGCTSFVSSEYTLMFNNDTMYIKTG